MVGAERMDEEAGATDSAPRHGECFLKVIDIPTDGSEPLVQGEAYTNRDLAHCISHMPEQLNGTVRVILDGRDQLGPVFPRAHRIQKNYPSCEVYPPWVSKIRIFPTNDKLYPYFPVNPELEYYGIPALRRMWDGSSEPWAYRAPSFVTHKYGCHNQKDRYEMMDVGFTVIHQEKGPVLLCVAPRASARGSLKALAANKAADKECANAAWTWLKEVDVSLSKEECMAKLAKGDKKSFIQLLLLELLIITLRRAFSFAVALERFGRVMPDSPSRAERLQAMLITLQKIEDAILHGSAAIEYVSQIVCSFSQLPSHPVESTSLAQQIQYVRGECDFYKRYISRQKEKENEVHTALVNKVNAKQARSVAQLTLLAALFLPLSLSAGVLSMQTRFQDLHHLLYDFVGVVLLFGTVAAALALVNRYGMLLYEYFLSLSYGWIYGRFNSVRLPLRLTVALLCWFVLLSSFLVGMLQDVKFGLKILGFEAAGITLLWLISVVVFRIAGNLVLERMTLRSLSIPSS